MGIPNIVTPDDLLWGGLDGAAPWDSREPEVPRRGSSDVPYQGDYCRFTHFDDILRRAFPDAARILRTAWPVAPNQLIFRSGIKLRLMRDDLPYEDLRCAWVGLIYEGNPWPVQMVIQRFYAGNIAGEPMVRRLAGSICPLLSQTSFVEVLPIQSA